MVRKKQMLEGRWRYRHRCLEYRGTLNSLPRDVGTIWRAIPVFDSFLKGAGVVDLISSYQQIRFLTGKLYEVL